MAIRTQWKRFPLKLIQFTIWEASWSSRFRLCARLTNVISHFCKLEEGEFWCRSYLQWRMFCHSRWNCKHTASHIKGDANGSKPIFVVVVAVVACQFGKDPQNGKRNVTENMYRTQCKSNNKEISEHTISVKPNQSGVISEENESGRC